MAITKEEIIEKTEEFILSQSVNYDLNLDFLARHCRVSKTKLYSVFGSKEGLIEHFVQYYCSKEQQSYKELLTQTPEKDKLQVFFTHLFELTDKLPHHYYAYLCKKSRKAKMKFDAFQNWIEQTYLKIISGDEQAEPSKAYKVRGALFTHNMFHFYTTCYKLVMTGEEELWKKELIKLYSTPV